MLVVGLSTGAAHAQAAADPGDIIVTATKRETKLIDTPMSVTVLPSSTLQAIHADDFADFARLVPGLSYIDSGPGNKRYALRGLQSAGEPEVALYYDEIPISGLPGGSLDTGDSQPDLKLWDVDRIEVLRGPQGTLYGNGSMGGAIRILSKRPVLDKVDNALEVSTGFTDGGAPSWRVSAMTNIPLVTDKLGLRVTGYYRHEGGWIDDIADPKVALPQIDRNNINGERTFGGRASLSYQPTETWNITAIGYYQDTRTSAFDLYPAFATAQDPYASKAYVREPWRDKIGMGTLISSTDFGWSKLVATGSFQRRTLERSTDTTRFLLIDVYGCTELNYGKTCFTPETLPAVSYSAETVEAESGEVRLESTMPAPLHWTIGAFIQDSTTTRRDQVAKVDAEGLIVLDPTNGDAINRLFERDNRDTFDQYAFFGEAAYDLTDRLSATVGLRWFHSDRTDQQVVVQQFFPGQPTGAEPFQRFKQGALFQKYELSYKLGTAGLVYAQAAQGFRAGGPNTPGGFNLSAPPYGADSVWDYEIGWKLDMFQRRLFWSGAVFRIDWKNLQELVPTALFNYIANAGRARSDGFESELDYVPLAGVDLSAGLTYNNARLVGPQPAQINPLLQLRSGDKLANVPDWTAHAGLSYSRRIADDYTGSFRIDGSYQSKRGSLVAVENPAYFVIGSSTLVDLHLALESDHHWRVGIDVDNLLNRYAPLSGKALDSNLVKTVNAARPRTVNLTLTLH